MPTMSAAAGERLAHALGHADLPGVVRAVDLGDDRREHRRARRHFHHLHVGAVARGDLRQLGARTAAAMSWLLRSRWCLSTQIDLQVAQLGLPRAGSTGAPGR